MKVGSYANDGSHGAELWKSDGTTNGTTLIKDIYAGSEASAPSGITVIGSTLYFTAYIDTTGYELWKSDGTENGTVMVKEIMPGTNSSFIGNITVISGKLYFSADDGRFGTELWTSDGTAYGTRRLTDVSPGTGNASPTNITSVNGHLVYLANDGSHGIELCTIPQDQGYVDLYYTASWQMIEQRRGGSTAASMQYVYSPVYVDALILRDSDADTDTGTGDLGITDSGLEQRLYVQQDANYNVTAITDTAGVVQERYLYDPYGEVIIAEEDYTPRVGNVSDFGWNYLFQGKRRDFAAGLDESRARVYDFMLGVWPQGEPYSASYIDGLNLYCFIRNNSVRFSDPSGFATINLPLSAPTYVENPNTFSETAAAAFSILTLSGLGGCNRPVATVGGAKEVDQNDIRWKEAIELLKTNGYPAAAENMAKGADEGTIQINPNIHDGFTGTPSKTVLPWAADLNSSDIASAMLGEYQRRINDGMGDNKEVADFIAKLKSQSKPPTRNWVHPNMTK